MIVRSASQDDFLAIAALFGRLHPEAGEARLTRVRQASRLLVAMTGGDQIAGAALATLTDYGLNASGAIEELIVDPRHRGEGVGAVLVSACANWLAEEGASVAFVSALDAQAEQFYLHSGFSRCTGPWLYLPLAAKPVD